MSAQGWNETLITATTDGATLTAAAAATALPAQARVTLKPNFFYYIGQQMIVKAAGRISSVITTPGTARFDICMGAAGTTIVFDTLALNLNVVAKTTIPWYFEAKLVCRAIGSGTSTTFFPMGSYFVSEAVVGSPLPTVGGNGSLLAPTGTPAVGAGMDNNAASILDVFFTQTVATGSMTVHNYQVDVLN